MSATTPFIYTAMPITICKRFAPNPAENHGTDCRTDILPSWRQVAIWEKDCAAKARTRKGSLHTSPTARLCHKVAPSCVKPLRLFVRTSPFHNAPQPALFIYRTDFCKDHLPFITDIHPLDFIRQYQRPKPLCSDNATAFSFVCSFLHNFLSDHLFVNRILCGNHCGWATPSLVSRL